MGDELSDDVSDDVSDEVSDEVSDDVSDEVRELFAPRLCTSVLESQHWYIRPRP